jgi:chromosome segregation ATPase
MTEDIEWNNINTDELSIVKEQVKVLEDQVMELLRCVELQDARFEAFVNLVVAYSNGASQDLTTFKQALEGVNDEIQTDAGDIDSGG